MDKRAFWVLLGFASVTRTGERSDLLTTCAGRTRRVIAPVRRGFTLIELMFTVAVLAILLALGVPGFQAVIQGNRAATQANDLITSLTYGRSEATRRGAAITVCPSTDQATCTPSNDWSTGWVVLDPAGALLRAWPELAGDSTLTGPQSLVFIGNGSVAPAPAQDFCLTVSADQVRVIEIARVGRVRVERAAC